MGIPALYLLTVLSAFRLLQMLLMSLVCSYRHLFMLDESNSSLSSSPACFAHSHDPNSFSTELCCKQVLVHTHCCNLLTAHLTIRTGCVLPEEMTTSYHGHAQTHTKGYTYRDYTGIVGFWHGSMHWCRRELERVCVYICERVCIDR